MNIFLSSSESDLPKYEWQACLKRKEKKKKEALNIKKRKVVQTAFIGLKSKTSLTTEWTQKPEFWKPKIFKFRRSKIIKAKSLPKMSITEPDFSSLAGMNPPNPVEAVMSGSRELEIDPGKRIVRF